MTSSLWSHAFRRGRSLLSTPPVPPNGLAPHAVPNSLDVPTDPTVKLDPQRLASFNPKVRNAIWRLHLRREYVSLDHILNEIKDWSVIEQLFYVEFVCQQQSGYIDPAVVCQPQYMVDAGTGKLRVDFRLSLRDHVTPILYFVELDGFRWHDRTPQEFAKGRRRIRVLQRKGARIPVRRVGGVARRHGVCV
jgi:hypothetical protein